MLAIFNRFDASVEEASWSLGVSPIRTFRKVTFPLIFPGVLSAMLFAFTLSYDEFSRTLFSSGRDLTLPLAIYGTFSVEIHPNIFAFGVLTTLFSFALLADLRDPHDAFGAARQAHRHSGGDWHERPGRDRHGSGLRASDAPSRCGSPATASASIVNDLIAATRADSVADEITAAGGRAIAIAGDVSPSRTRSRRSSPARARRSAIAAPRQQCRPCPSGAVRRYSTPADFDRMFAVHVRGDFLDDPRRAAGHARRETPA